LITDQSWFGANYPRAPYRGADEYVKIKMNQHRASGINHLGSRNSINSPETQMEVRHDSAAAKANEVDTSSMKVGPRYEHGGLRPDFKISEERNSEKSPHTLQKNDDSHPLYNTVAHYNANHSIKEFSPQTRSPGSPRISVFRADGP